MNEVDIVDKGIEKTKLIALKVADQVPLPLHYIFNGILLLITLVSWLTIFSDPIPFVDEIVTAATVYYYNAYLLKRTFGALNPLHILRGESPAAKRKLGLLPYDQYMSRIHARIKAMRKAVKSAEVPGLSHPKVDRLATQVGEIEKRLRLLDRLLIRPEFQEGNVKSEIAKIQARIETVDQQAVKEEFTRAIAHADKHLGNIQRLHQERNRLVARLERFSLQLDQIYSQLLATSAQDQQQLAEAERQFEELFTAINAFDETLQELESKPSSDLYQAAVKEVAETEEKFKAAAPVREGEKTL